MFCKCSAAHSVCWDLYHSKLRFLFQLISNFPLHGEEEIPEERFVLRAHLNNTEGTTAAAVPPHHTGKTHVCHFPSSLFLKSPLKKKKNLIRVLQPAGWILQQSSGLFYFMWKHIRTSLWVQVFQSDILWVTHIGSGRGCLNSHSQEFHFHNTGCMVQSSQGERRRDRTEEKYQFPKLSSSFLQCLHGGLYFVLTEALRRKLRI